MYILTKSPYSRWFYFALFIYLVAAVFSVGYHHPDEHFQILELANYKLGKTSANQLTWEFSTKCRPALQPFIAYCIGRLLIFLNCYNPFTLALLLRLLMAVCSWFVTCRLVLLFLPYFSTERGKKLFVLGSFFLWFMPYISVRFSAENFSGTLFFLALSFLLTPFDNTNKRLVNFAAAGFILGLSVFTRLQIAAALPGLTIWAFFIQKWKLKQWIILILAGLVAIGLCVVIDYWLYGTWTFTPYNYYYVNIVQKIAASFGVSPWWSYFKLFIETALPPVSVALLYTFLKGIYIKPAHITSLVLITFVAGHSMIGHKEMRFLFPVIPAFIFLYNIGLEKWIVQYSGKRIFETTLTILIAINTSALLVRVLIPAQESTYYYSYIYKQAQENKVIIVSMKQTPYNTIGAEANFYRPSYLDLRIVQNEVQLQNIINNAGDRPVLFVDTDLSPEEISSISYRRIYCILPTWLLHFNPNHWQQRSNIWSIYRLS